MPCWLTQALVRSMTQRRLGLDRRGDSARVDLAGHPALGQDLAAGLS
jgi:hypothetical protein